jgi:hypothetical protein
MNISALFARALWLVLAVSALWVILVTSSNYAHCRADGSGKMWCFADALIGSAIQVIVFALGTVVKLLLLVLP